MAVSVLYSIRGGGYVINAATTPPTAAQAQLVYMQKAFVQFGADTDVQAFFTHNWGLDISAPGFYDPEAFIVAITMGANGTFMPAFTFDFANTNVTKINKLSQAVTNGNYLVTLRRPHSMGQ